jgi:uncharacterized protein YdeI (YjbR/CyaY-like superfamily)
VTDREHVEVRTRAELRAWLAAHHAVSSGVWLVTPKRSSAADAPTYDDIVEECLCFGWIDSRPGRVDERRSKRLLTPRSRRSGWSALNKRRIADLERRGLIEAAGRDAVARAKADGTWSRLDESEAGTTPDDLDAAFARHPGSRAAFDGFPAGERRRILQWIATARRPETRARRVEECASLAAQGLRANAWRPQS